MFLIILGFLSGILSGMGVGGGMLLIPALRIFTDASQQTAQTVNLYYFIPCAAAALIIHIKNKNVDKTALSMIVGGLPMSILGSFLAVRISAEILSKLFAVFIMIFGISELIGCFKISKGSS